MFVFENLIKLQREELELLESKINDETSSINADGNSKDEIAAKYDRQIQGIEASSIDDSIKQGIIENIKKQKNHAIQVFENDQKKIKDKANDSYFSYYKNAISDLLDALKDEQNKVETNIDNYNELKNKITNVIVSESKKGYSDKITELTEKVNELQGYIESAHKYLDKLDLTANALKTDITSFDLNTLSSFVAGIQNDMAKIEGLEQVILDDYEIFTEGFDESNEDSDSMLDDEEITFERFLQRTTADSKKSDDDSVGITDEELAEIDSPFFTREENITTTKAEEDGESSDKGDTEADKFNIVVTNAVKEESYDDDSIDKGKPDFSSLFGKKSSKRPVVKNAEEETKYDYETSINSDLYKEVSNKIVNFRKAIINKTATKKALDEIFGLIGKMKTAKLDKKAIEELEEDYKEIKEAYEKLELELNASKNTSSGDEASKADELYKEFNEKIAKFKKDIDNKVATEKQFNEIMELMDKLSDTNLDKKTVEKVGDEVVGITLAFIKLEKELDSIKYVVTKNEETTSLNPSRDKLEKMIENETSITKLKELRKDIKDIDDKDDAKYFEKLIDKKISELEKKFGNVDDLSDEIQKMNDNIVDDCTDFINITNVDGEFRVISSNNYNHYNELLNKYTEKIIVMKSKINPSNRELVVAYNKLVSVYIAFKQEIIKYDNLNKYKSKDGGVAYKFRGKSKIKTLKAESLKEKKKKKTRVLFANTKEILEAENVLSELNPRLRVNGASKLGKKSRKVYETVQKNIAKSLYKELAENSRTLDVIAACDGWVRLLATMPLEFKYDSEIITRGTVVDKFKSFLDLSLKSKDKDRKITEDQYRKYINIIVNIFQYRDLIDDFYDFKDNGNIDEVEDDLFYMDTDTILGDITYIDPEKIVENYVRRNA